jgi:prevent-host-death family protein
MARLSATEVARRFSEVLNRVAQGEEIEVSRAGMAVAVIVPPKVRLASPEHFGELLASAPAVDDDFVDAVRELRRAVGPPESSWPY